MNARFSGRALANALIIVAIIPGVLAEWDWTRYHWPALDQKIVVHHGWVRTQDFRTRVDAVHCVYFQFKPAIGRARMDCLLGKIKSEGCRESPAVLDLAWTVRSAGRVVAQGMSTSPRYGCLLTDAANSPLVPAAGSFTAKAGGHYVLAIDFHGKPEELNSASPRLIAKPAYLFQDTFAYEQYFALAWALAFYIASRFVRQRHGTLGVSCDK